MKRLLAIFFLGSSMLALSACNTIDGAGKDVESVGDGRMALPATAKARLSDRRSPKFLVRWNAAGKVSQLVTAILARSRGVQQHQLGGRDGRARGKMALQGVGPRRPWLCAKEPKQTDQRCV